MMLDEIAIVIETNFTDILFLLVHIYSHYKFLALKRLFVSIAEKHPHLKIPPTYKQQ